MNELRELYQEMILDHGRRPRHFGAPPEPCGKAEGRNPLCGDEITVYVRKDDDGKLADLRFEGQGCAICLASASLMAEHLQCRSEADCDRCFHAFHDLVTGKTVPDDAEETLGKLAVFAGVREYPIRVKCATLAWHTLRSALRDGKQASCSHSVSTE